MKPVLPFLLLLLLTGCATPPRDTVFQTSTIDALIAGVYDGHMTCGELLSHGDTGIGTFDHLDGEMVVIDGTVYQVTADGAVHRPAASMTTPFATVCEFSPDTCFALDPGTDYASLKSVLDARAPNRNLFYALSITGRFSRMLTRSVPRQSKPYPPLTEVTAHQPRFTNSHVTGTIIGFRCPAYVKGINVPGYHLHFLSDDRTAGGHILDFTCAHATCDLDTLTRFTLVLPDTTDGFARANLARDRSRELDAVEK